MQGRIGIETEAKITLKEMIEKVLANDPELAISQISLEQAGYNIKSSQGYFDPVFSLDASKSRTSIRNRLGDRRIQQRPADFE